MKEILLTQGHKLFKALVACTAIIILSLFQADKLYLLGALLVGYLVGIVWYGLVMLRMLKSSKVTAMKAKKNMIQGMILRLILLGVVLAVAINISMEVFISVVSGFALVYIIGLLLLIVASYQ